MLSEIAEEIILEHTRKELHTLAPKVPSRNRPPVLSPRLTYVRRLPPRRLLPTAFHSPVRNRDRDLSREGKFFFRTLFGPHTSRRVHSHLWGFRYETLPAFRHRAQTRLYRGIVQQIARLEKRQGKGGLFRFLLGVGVGDG